MKVQRHRGDPWYKCALYEVWRDMMRTGRRLFNQRLTDGTGDGFPVDPMFRDFDRFVLWARICRHYRIGEMDDYRIERYNLSKGFTPDNCFFTREPPTYTLGEGPDITPGAKCLWKEKAGKCAKWDGLSRTRLYDIWKGMVRRCTDPGQKDYKDYGGRGIKVCDAWKKDFIVFYDWAWDHGYSPYLSLDRVNVDGDYSPDNCRWAGELEQRLNTRKYKQMYTNLRLRVADMRNVLAQLDDNIVVTLIVRSAHLPGECPEQADYPPVPLEDRQDIERQKG